MYCWTYWWCVRSYEQNDVMTALGLTAPRPVTYALADGIIDRQSEAPATVQRLSVTFGEAAPRLHAGIRRAEEHLVEEDAHTAAMWEIPKPTG